MFRLAHDLRSEVETDVDVDTAWRELEARVSMPMTTPTSTQHRPPRRVWLLAAAAVLMVAIAGVVLIVRNDDDTVRTNEPGSVAPTLPSTVPSPITSTAPQSTSPDTTPDASPTNPPTGTEPSPTTAPPPPVSPVTVGVSFLDPPAEASSRPFGSFSYASPEQAAAPMALGELGVVYALGGSIGAIGFDGSERVIPLADGLEPYSLVYGPGDVVYALANDESATTLPSIRLVAIPLSGDAAGTVVAQSEELPGVAYVELPTVTLGHGPDGIVALAREPGRTLLGYVDESGQPRTWDLAPSEVALIDEAEFVRSSTAAWQLAIERDPSWSSPFAGQGGVAPSQYGNFVYPTTIGPPIDPAADVSDNTLPVIAVLNQYGGAWWSIPDGWQFESSSPAGVLISRLDTTNLQRVMALVDVRPPAVPLDSLPSEDSGIARTCVEGEMCTQLALDPFGTLISYEPSTRTMTRHSDPPVSAQIALEFIGWQPGADGAVYFTVQDPSIPDPIGDVVAVSLAAGDSGRQIERWPGVADLSGDSQYVATPEGFVLVGCCSGPGVVPAIDAPVAIEWVGPLGGSAGDMPRIRFDSTGFVYVDDTEWQVDVGDDEQSFGLRGMPPIVPTDDGGFIAALPDVNWSMIRLARGYPDGTVQTVDVLEHPALLETSGTVLYPDGESYRRFSPFTQPI